MKLEPPLIYLIKSCETICVAGCCGLAAFDFSPVHIASYLISSRGFPDEDDIKTILNQLKDIKINYGGADKVTIDELDQEFTQNQLIELLEEITANIPIALDVIKQSEARRYVYKDTPE